MWDDVGEICESKRSDMFEVLDVDFIRLCGVVVFAVFCLLDVCCGEHNCSCL